MTEDELLSGIDRNDPDVSHHVETCETCQTRAAEFRAGIEAVSTAATPPVPPLPVTIGSYLVNRRLGEGGMGIVYEAQQQVPKRLVAIKVVRGGHHVDEYRIRLFEREAHALARLKHPAIAAIYEGGLAEDGQPFFAMELVHGAPLNEHVRKGKLPRRKRLELFGSICDAINYAHQRGVIHRDLKPTNILVDAEGHPKVLDFGLARITDPEGTLKTATIQVGRIMGTLPYMSPEEAVGNADEIDVRSDVYSLGVVFYELMTDRLPFKVKRAALPEAIRIICEEAPRRPASIDRTLRGDLETIALKALEKEPSRRYQSVAAFSEDIERYLTDQPILARRTSVLYQLHKFIVRQRVFVIFTIAILAVVVAARTWVDRMESGLRDAIQLNIDLQDFAGAVTKNRLAESLLEQQKHDEAEPFYRSALATFQRLDRDDHAGPAMLALASLLISRPVSEGVTKDQDFMEARLWLDSAIESLEDLGPGEPDDLLAALSVQLDLGSLWVEHSLPADADRESDYESAQDLYLEALEVYGGLGKDGHAGRRRALLLLQSLYGPDLWDHLEGSTSVEAALEALDKEVSDELSPRPALRPSQ